MIPCVVRRALLTGGLSLLVFGGLIRAPFYLDDYSLLTSGGPPGFLTALLSSRVLTVWTFRLNFLAGGFDPIGYHVINLLLHVGCVLAAYRFFVRLLPAAAAVTATAIFALHPIQTEAIGYVFARGTLLAALFSLLALGAWVRGHHWQTVGWFSLGLLSKEDCAALPLFLLLLHASISRNRKELVPIGAMLGLSLAFGLRVIAETARIAGAGSGFGAGISPAQYFWTQSVVILRYLRLLFLPLGFTFDPDIPRAPWFVGAAGWLLVLALVVAAERRFDQAKAGFFAIGGLVLLAPSSSIFPAADLAADRRMYLPLTAFAAAIALLLRNRSPKWGVLLIAVLGGLSAGRVAVWSSAPSLWSEAVAAAPAKLRPRIQLARALPPADGAAMLEQARGRFRANPVLEAEIGRAYLGKGDPAGALQAFGRALALAPGDPDALNNRGVALAALGQAEAARADFERALARNRCHAAARENLLASGGAAPPASADCAIELRGGGLTAPAK